MTGFFEETSSIKLISAKDSERQIPYYQTEIRTNYHNSKSMRTTVKHI